MTWWLFPSGVEGWRLRKSGAGAQAQAQARMNSYKKGLEHHDFPGKPKAACSAYAEQFQTSLVTTLTSQRRYRCEPRWVKQQPATEQFAALPKQELYLRMESMERNSSMDI